MLLLRLLFLTAGAAFVTSAPLEDLVESLPDFGPPPTSQFSGYLDGTAGCDTAANGDFCKIHYWLALAEENPLEKPVCCGSMVGLVRPRSWDLSKKTGRC